MIETTYENELHDPDNPTVRYVRYNPNDGKFHWGVTCIRSMSNVKQGTCDAEDLPANIAKTARLRSVIFPACVDWPVTK